MLFETKWVWLNINTCTCFKIKQKWVICTNLCVAVARHNSNEWEFKRFNRALRVKARILRRRPTLNQHRVNNWRLLRCSGLAQIWTKRQHETSTQWCRNVGSTFRRHWVNVWWHKWWDVSVKAGTLMGPLANLIGQIRITFFRRRRSVEITHQTRDVDPVLF